MSHRPSIVLVVGATGSIGRHAVAEALQQGWTVRALVRDKTRAARILPDGVELVVGDLTRPETLDTAVEDVEAIVFTHGSTTNERDVRDNDYTGVANVLKTLDGRRTRIALMTAIGTTRPGVAYARWKLRSERLIRASDNPYTIVRPGWFDYNQPGQRKIVMLQGDRRQSGSPADGVIARDQIARVLIDSLHIDAADHKTLELVADNGPEQDDLTTVFTSLTPDPAASLDAAEDIVELPAESEPEMFRRDLAQITAGSAKAG
ncbi:SDR family oxidoreductase [Arthrobacter sp. B2a2-09]|uniref:SDR family oxidoreductase n=1 Tax=Arthrobacter sp. B2a2-09 TaxID=2952822 RepID=UPI0022CD437F|nr:SDR family oxidoreductase [Arthrobacter sp. B2a2-09]MCZ9880240.1 SDR family oxidoreductase [Arthrobacter sp. B2a2-09]